MSATFITDRNTNQSAGSIGPSRRPRITAVRKAVAALALAMAALLAAPTLSGSSVEAAVASQDGRIVSNRGSTATVSLTCSGINAEIAFDNHGFDYMNIYLYNASTGTGSWTGWWEIEDRNYHGFDWRKPNTSHHYQMYFYFWDGSYAGEWVPFLSAAVNVNTGIACGPNGAHN